MKKNTRRVVAFAFLASMVFSANALAQWQWLDDSGRKVFSDMPPPNAVPDSRILARPGHAAGLTMATENAATQTAGGAAQDRSTGRAQQGADAAQAASVQEVPPSPEELAQEKAQAAEQAAVQAQNKQIKAANCSAARRMQGQLDSGRRATTTNARGEVVFMDEATRNQQRQQAQSIIDSNC